MAAILNDDTRLSAAPCTKSIHHINKHKLFIQNISPFRIGLSFPADS